MASTNEAPRFGRRRLLRVGSRIGMVAGGVAMGLGMVDKALNLGQTLNDVEQAAEQAAQITPDEQKKVNEAYDLIANNHAKIDEQILSEKQELSIPDRKAHREALHSVEEHRSKLQAQSEARSLVYERDRLSNRDTLDLTALVGGFGLGIASGILNYFIERPLNSGGETVTPDRPY